VIIRINC